MNLSRFLGLLLSGVILLGTACSPKSQSDTAQASKSTQAQRIFAADPAVVKLAQAIEQDDVEQVRALIKQGIDLNAEGRWGLRPLSWAMLKHKPRPFEILLQHGANPNTPIDPAKERERDSAGDVVRGRTVMEFAARMEDPQYLRLALKYKGDPNFPINKDETIVYAAIDAERPRNVRVLIDSGLDISHRDRGGTALIHSAAGSNAYDVVLMLLEAGADPTVKNTFGRDLAREMTEFGERRIEPDSENHRAYKKVAAEMKKRGLLK